MTYPGTPNRFSVGTRYGVLHSTDGGLNWAVDSQIDPQSDNLFRDGDLLIYNNNARTHLARADGSDTRQPIEGMSTMISDAVAQGGVLFMKNNRGFHLAGDDLVDIYTGLVFHEQFEWVSELACFSDVEYPGI